MRLNLFSLLLLVLLVRHPLLGQEAVEFDPVEASVADVSVLATSLRIEDPGLAPGTGFKQVYQVPGSTSAHFRANGGLFAVFDQSVYLSWNGFSFPEVPPSTTFYIGTPDFLVNQPGMSVNTTPGVTGTVSPSSLRKDARSSGEPGDRPGYGYVPSTDSSQSLSSIDATNKESSEDLAEDVLPRFHTDPDYRRRRLMEIRRKCEAAGPNPLADSTP